MRGNNKARRRRKEWLLETFDPELGNDLVRCHLVISDRCLGLLDYSTLTVDRIVPGSSYRRGGIRPACAPCQNRQGGLGNVRTLAQLLEEYRYAREMWEVRFEETNYSYYPGIIAVERRKERRGGRREITDWLEENPPPVFKEWLTEWHAARREQEVAS